VVVRRFLSRGKGLSGEGGDDLEPYRSAMERHSPL
jgi:hypothetical protein